MEVGEDRPTAAITLSVAGLALQALGGLFLAYAVSYYSSSYGSLWSGFIGPCMAFWGPWTFGFYSYWFALFAILAAVEIALGVLGVLWMNGTGLSKIRVGSVLVLIASIIAFPTMFGFIVGSLLMLVGSILGLTWVPRGALR
jgi:hypothetical protein